MSRFCARTLFLAFVASALGLTFAADSQTPKIVIPSSYFGLHIHHLAYPIPTPWPNIPVPQWRLWDADVTWPDLEPNKGQWKFEKLDGYVSQAEKHGTGLLLPLGGSPPWASARPNVPSNYYKGFTAEPANMEDWRTFVRAVATRYKGRIQAYEIWNEPNLQDFWTGTMDQMIDLTKEAAEIIHSLDPHALVVSPAATADYGIPWIEEFVKKGGAHYVDVIGFHFYVNPHTLLPEEMVPLIQRVRKVLADNGLNMVPIWNTETGWLPPAKFDSDELAASFLARAYLVSWAAGVERFYWYSWDNGSLAIVTYLQDSHRITPAGNAYKTMEDWLIGARMDSCTETTSHTWTCELDRSGKKEWIVWNSQTKSRFEVPPVWHVSSITALVGNRISLPGSSIDIGQMPLLLTGRP